MIVRMKKTTVLCLAEDRKKTIDKLGDLGVIHIQASPVEESGDRAELLQRYSDAERVLGVVHARHSKHGDAASPMDDNAACEIATTLLKQYDNASKRLEAAVRSVDLLEPWGEFNSGDLHKLSARGIQVWLCSAGLREMKLLQEKFPEAFFQTISEHKKHHYFVVISRAKLDSGELPLATIPGLTLSEARAEVDRARREIVIIDRQLDEIVLQLPQLRKYKEKLAKELEFATVHDCMESHGKVVSLHGFVPVTDLDRLKRAALENGWALLLQDPDDVEPVPTLVRLPKWLNFSKVILDFVGISQGYRETDVSVCFLVFFTIFFGMIVGDVGYGIIFMICSVMFYLLSKRRNPRMLNAAKLGIILSCSSLTVGLLSGNFFGMPSELLPGFLKGIDFLTNPKTGDDNLKWLCFLIAMIHLGLARLWRTILARSWRVRISEIGWGMLLVANFYTASSMIAQRVFPDFAMYLYGGGLLFTVIGIDWKDLGNAFNYPFSLIGTFTDTLSYIRLYAVGMSGVYIAKSFNDMGLMVLDIPAPDSAMPLVLIGTALVILAGHLLNIVLSLMGVLVHGIRLNTLEFSNSMGLQWAGYQYKPLKKNMDHN
jgi:V/A-type H+-transporting ATPase subunit I